jgi:hypothetical protein
MSPTKIEIVEKRESRRASLGINKTRNATNMQRIKAKMFDKNAPKKFLTRKISKI